VKRIEGFMCDNQEGEPHFTCHLCFTEHVKHKMEEDIGLLVKAGDVQVCCPGFPCKSRALTPDEILSHAGDAFPSYLTALQKVVESRTTVQVHANIAEENARIARMNEQERKVHDSRKHITEEILTLKCPRENCRQAFLDFDGCYALNCSKCNCGFCAYCLKDCGRDAHAHVANCPIGGNRGVYGGGNFAAVQLERRKRLLREHFRTLDADICAQVIDLCRIDLQDLQMGDMVQEFGRRVPAAGAAGGGRGEVEDVEEMAQLLEDDEIIAQELQFREMELNENGGDGGEGGVGFD